MKLVVATVAVVTTALAASVGTAIGSFAPRSTAVRAPDRPVAISKPSPRPKARLSTTEHPSYRTTGARGISTAALNSVIETYCQDCHNENLMTGNLSLAGAVHNSARFSYLSPAGLIWHLDENTQKKAIPWGYVVDGGYFENSGAGTLAPLIRTITRSDPVNAKRLVLIIFSNDPSDGKSDYVCPDPNEDLEPLPIGGRETWPRFLQEREPLPSHFGIEVTAPPIALYQTRTSRAHAASVVARNRRVGMGHSWLPTLPRRDASPGAPQFSSVTRVPARSREASSRALAAIGLAGSPSRA